MKKIIQKAAEVTGNLIGNKIADKITKVWKTSQQNNSETVKKEHDKILPKERYTFREERQKKSMILDWYNSIIMEYHKILNLLDNTPNQPSKFKTRNCVEIKDSQGAYTTNSQMKFKTSMLRSNACGYSDVYILVKGISTVSKTAAGDAALNNRTIHVILKKCAPFVDCTSEIKNAEIDHPKDIDVIMSMYNLITCTDNYSKTSESLCNTTKMNQL